MGEDLSTGAKIAIILVILAALIATVFSIMALVKNVTNQSVDDLQSSLSAFQNMKWQDYDQRQVSGNMVQVTIRSATENNVAIIVKTNHLSDRQVNYGVLLNGYDKGSSSQYYTRLEASSPSDTEGLLPSESGSYYTASYKQAVGTDAAGFMYAQYNRGISDSSDPYYINPTLKFNSFLIKDSSGSLLGVYFEEKNLNVGTPGP